MLEKTAASLEPCGFHRVVPGATQSFRTSRQLRNAFWQHGAADIELTAAWQSLMHGTFNLTMSSVPEENNGSVLSASAFLLDFLYPSGAMNLMRRLTPAAPVSGRPDSFRYGHPFGKIMPRLYTSSLSKRQVRNSGSEATADPKANEPDSSVSVNPDDVTYNDISVKYAGIEMLWGDWHKFHTIPSYRAFQRYLAFYASRGDTEPVYRIWRTFIEVYRDDAKLPALRSDDIFAHLMQVHAVRGEVINTQQIFNDVSKLFHLENSTHHWNILLNSYVKAGDYDEAISTFENLVAAGKWDRYSFGTMMQMAGDRGDLGFTIDLYRQLLSLGGQADAAILGAIVDAYCRNDHMQSAEDVCVRAASKGIVDTQMWNKLLYYHAIRRDLAAINRLLTLMADKEIPYNYYTYQQLLIGLSICRQSHHALNLLTAALRENIFTVTIEHFHIVMGALLVTGDPGAVLRLDKLMQDYGFPSSSDSLFLLTQRLGQFRNLPPWQRARLTPTEWLGEAFRSFYRIYGLQHRKKLDKLIPGRLHSKAGELLQQNTEKSHFSTMVSMLTELKDFAGARELVDLYRYIFQGEEDLGGILPGTMLNSLMRADFQEARYDRVITTWELLFETAKQEARSADYVEDLPHTPKVSAKYRYVLSSGIMIMQKLFFEKGDAASIRNMVREVREAGFELDSQNWNYYIQALVQLKDYKEAFTTCEELLMPNWTGWFLVRHRESVKNKLPLDLRRKGSSPRHLRPIATTLYHLTRGYMELDRLSVWSSEFAATFYEIEKECVQVVRAIKSMTRLRSRHESSIIVIDAFSASPEFTYWWSPSPDVMRAWHASRIRGRFGDRATQQFKIADASSGAVVAFAKWDPPSTMEGLREGFVVYDGEGREVGLEGKGEGGEAVQKKLLKAPEGADEKLYEEFFDGLKTMGEKWRSHEKLVLSIICTDPSHHGRGIATSLIRPVLALADKERIPTYLEALPLAVPLYQRLGFQPVDRLEYDLAKAGRRGKAVLTIMVREPQSA
ncbi:hypothetical protein GL218_08797 [Daldinia childiae]|uniref:uncharacterized protein n=1 Tax=Daldinia childiae TaxID=326645 RepID=UPI001447388C|nr:uncharacterized protein GL218_08797 [Daldinia childiae]KAF3067165.1 hypothetical protein GL218_08797 [Daldinia childiae]